MNETSDSLEQPKQLIFQPSQTAVVNTQVSSSLRARQIKDRNGCKNCKRRKLKCPDALTPCQRCKSRGENCERNAETQTQWRVVLPRLPQAISTARGVQIDGADWSLLDDWFTKSCRLMCNEADQSLNPFSSSLMQTLASSRAAIHTIQSLSAAYQEAFQLSEMRRSYEERGRALYYLRQSISSDNVPTDVELFCIVMIGMATAWFSNSTEDVGTEHLAAAHAAIVGILTIRMTEALESKLFLLSAGLYIYWDMACSFATMRQMLPVRDPRLLEIAKTIDQTRPPSPVLGVAARLFLLLGSVGRYCQHVFSTKVVNPTMEADLQKRLCNWEPLDPSPDLEEMIKIAEIYRSTGLIVLDSTKAPKDRDDDFQTRIESTFENVATIGITSPLFGFQTLILAMIAGEISEEKSRGLITRRFFELYRYNRLRVNYEALSLIQETWRLHDMGDKISLLELMQKKGLSLMLG